MKKRQLILSKLKDAMLAGTWHAQASQIPGVPTFRWTQELDTPAWDREGANPSWPGEKYDRHVFLTLVSMDGPWIMRVASCPWVRASDSTPPLWLVEKIIEEPELAFDTQRILDLKHERRGTGRPRSTW